jgi:hypothetical protein
MGASNGNQGLNTKFYQLKAKVDATQNPHFVLSEKIDGTWKQTEKFDTMTGMLAGAEIREKEYKGSKKKVFILKFEDENELSQVELTHNGTTYNIINTLSSDCNIISTYSIQVYKKQVGDKFYSQASIKMDGNRMAWSFEPQTAPKKEAVMVGGKPFLKDGQQVYDDTLLCEFFEKLFQEKIINKLASLKGGNTSKAQVIESNKPSEAQPGNDDLPF